MHWRMCAAAFLSKISECCSKPQSGLCSPDPLDQSCAADLSPFSFLILSTCASPCFPLSASSLPASSLPACLFLLSSFFCFVTAYPFGDTLMLVLSKATLPEHSTLGNMQISFNPFLFCLFSNPYSVKRLFHFYSLIYFIYQQYKLFKLTLSILQTLSFPMNSATMFTVQSDHWRGRDGSVSLTLYLLLSVSECRCGTMRLGTLSEPWRATQTLCRISPLTKQENCWLHVQLTWASNYGTFRGLSASEQCMARDDSEIIIGLK